MILQLWKIIKVTPKEEPQLGTIKVIKKIQKQNRQALLSISFLNFYINTQENNLKQCFQSFG